MAVSNDFRCFSCSRRYEADAAGDDAPPCAFCGSVDTIWVPTKMAIRHVGTTNTDAIVQDLADAHGLTDINKDQRYGEPAIRSRPAANRQELQERAMRGEVVSGFVGGTAPEAGVANGVIRGKVGEAGAAPDPSARPAQQGTVVAGQRLAGLKSMTRIVASADSSGKIIG